MGPLVWRFKTCSVITCCRQVVLLDVFAPWFSWHQRLTCRQAAAFPGSDLGASELVVSSRVPKCLHRMAVLAPKAGVKKQGVKPGRFHWPLLFPVRNLDGTFYAQVFPFDPSFVAVKVHPSGALLFTPHHSQLTLLQHIIRQAPFLKKPVQFLDDTPKYWLEDDGTMCLHPSHRWKSDDTIAWLRKRGLHSVPDSIKAEIGDLVYNGPKMNDASTSTSPPGRFVYFTGGRASNDPPPGLGKVPWQ